MKKVLSLILAFAIISSLGIFVSYAEDSVIPKEASWQITATDNYPGQKPANAFDGNSATMWHSLYEVNSDGTMKYDREGHAITVNFGKSIKVSGFKYQRRLDNRAGVITGYEIYASVNGKDFKEIYNGKFDFGKEYEDMSEKSASWGDTEMCAIKILVTESYAGHATAAEFSFLTGTSGTKNGSGKAYVPTGAGLTKEEEEVAVKSVSLESVGGTILEKEASWVITESDKFGSFGANLAFDGNPKTYYHSFYKVKESGGMEYTRNGHEIMVDFGKATKVSGWVYQRRTDDKSGVISGYEIYVSDNGTDYTKIYKGAFNYGKDYADMSAKIGSWGDVETRYIKIVSTDGYAGHATASEISFITGSKKVEEDAPENQKEEVIYTAENGVKSVSRKGWKVSVNSALNSAPIENIIDGNTKTYWHSFYQASGTTIIKKDGLPYIIEVVLPEETLISGLVFIPRQDNESGRFILTDIYAADSDDSEYFLLVKGYKTETNPSTNELLFNSNVKVKKLKIEVISGYGTYGTLAEFYAVGKNDKCETVEYEAFEEYEKKNKLYPIKQSEIMLTSEHKVWEPHTITLVADGNNETFWQTESVTKGTNIFFRADLGRVNKFSKISYMPRQTNDHHGLWKKASIWISVDGENWDCAVEDHVFEKSLGEHFINLKEAVSARYVDFEITEYEENRASCAEINFWQDYETYLEFGMEKDEKYELKIDSNIIKVTHGEEVKEKEIDVAPYIVNGSTLIPLRGLLEEMGATIGWDGETQTVTITKGIKKIELQIWSKMVYIDDGVYGRVRHTMLNFPVIKDSRTFIPVRFVSEMLGYNVSWDGETKTITINK